MASLLIVASMSVIGYCGNGGRSPSIVVDDVATFVEHGLEFTVYDYVHGLFQCGCKVNLDAEITLFYQMETATVKG